ncbi:unnamed protein product, partial [Brassica rapa]
LGLVFLFHDTYEEDDKKKRERETREENAEERETVKNDEDAEERDTVRNDEDAEGRETVRNKEDAEERETVRNVEGAVVFREYEEDMKSGKRDKMDEAEDTLGRFEYEIESTKRSYLHNLLNLLKLKTS